MALLEVRDLNVCYRKKGGLFRKDKILHAVKNVSFDLEENQIIGLVGESGCGKSTLGRAIMQLESIQSGSIKFDGVDMQTLKGAKLRKFRKNFQMIFQDPYSSLNPRMTIHAAMDEILKLHTRLDESWREKRIVELLEAVGLNYEALNRYPHQFSGGQRQRIGIAKALAVQPKLIVADEPVSALDVSVQASIINLLSEIRKRSFISFIFIAHDLSVVEHISDIIMVMYLGEIVESGPAHEVVANPQHPYTKALLSAVPKITDTPENNSRILLKGDPPSPYEKHTGCPFFSRCPMSKPECGTSAVSLVSADGSNHLSSCLYPEEVKNL
ncbi:MAG: ATP-binding cassette domain-containing protein [Lentisphaeria bacterium]|nr:ATP-binding cassette domain-containing protein [Lentisphaeria bacterium]